MIIGIINQKGGVGKTTTAINISAALAERYKVLLMDLDPQGNASSGLGITTPEKSVYDVLAGNMTPAEAIYDTAIDGLKLIPATTDLAGAALELDATKENLYLLKEALGVIKEDYDFIFLDAPPSIGSLTLNILVASEAVIIPLQAEYYALEGVAGLSDTIERIKSAYNPDLNILGVILTMFDGRTKLSQEVEDNVRQYFGDKVFWNVIPRNIRLAEAPSYGQTIFEYAPTSQGAAMYRRFAEEVMQRAGKV